jgi:parallel beta-helix repeat protein
MSRKLVFALSLFVLLSSLPYVRFNSVEVKSSNGYPVHNLDTHLNYTAIQEAIDAPETLDGHTIFVEEGKYYEHVIVNKSLSLVGENISTTVIDGNFSGNPVTIASSHVNMTSFTVQEAWLGIWYVFNGFGIYLATGVSYNNISHNIITNNLMYGIMLNASSHNIISDNIIRNNNSSGVTIWSSSNNMIFNNTIQNCGLIIGGSGITVFNSTENIVYDNIVLDNGLGIALCCSGHNQLYNNNMTDNRYNFEMTGLSKSDFNNSIDMSNLVDGRHIYCLQSAKNVVVDSQLNIANLYIIDSENITLKDLVLTKNGVGLLLWETNDSRIENVTVSDNHQGVDLTLCANITVCRCSITNNDNGGIHTNCSLMCNISGNEIRANGNFGIWMDYSSNVSIDGNTITKTHGDGIMIAYGGNNSISGNSIAENFNGVRMFSAYGNKFYHNNFIQNRSQVFLYDPSSCIWDSGLEGNYWSDYNGTDSNQDGIGDTSHILNVDNTDHYPLMGMFSSFNTTLTKHVNVVSNSTIKDFEYFESNSTIRMYVSNMTTNQTFGFCRVCISHVLMNQTYRVTVNGTEPYYWNYTLYDDGNNRWIYFSYQHSTIEIIIIPEFPSFLILPLFMIATLLAVIVYKKRAKSDRFYKK